MNGPNDQQKKLIESTEGIFISDAGAGTGKTHAISLRYAHILETKGVEPDDILLITFTNNAAENMKERIINLCGKKRVALRDAPISTFHSLCNNILNRYGFRAPEILGIDDRITPSTSVMENQVIEEREFLRFFNSFIEEHPEYSDFYRILWRYQDLLGLIKSLGSKGIIPTSEGWFRNSEKHLDGDFEGFMECFNRLNEPLTGATGPINSKLRAKMSGYSNGYFTPDAPGGPEMLEDKQIPERYASLCFNEDREELKRFVHDVYFEYIKYALSRNYINFNLMVMFAFALLCDDDGLREKLRFDYVMIDEFQDTNEIQFKLALLLSRTGNICVVGDWKQSIFSFQYASVDNILKFQERLEAYSRELNEDGLKIDYPTVITDSIPLYENYRSTQEVIDFSRQGLLVKATVDEELDQEEIESQITDLKAVKNFQHTEIGAYTADDEVELILWKIDQLVNDEAYGLDYGDVAVLTRTRKFGLKLLKAAEEKNIPVAYEGGIELFKTEPSLLLLAWLRVVKDRNSVKGWAVILDRAGYLRAELEKILEDEYYPGDMHRFRGELERTKTIGQFARTVFNRYGMNDAFCDRIIQVLQGIYDSTYLNSAEIIRFMEDNIEMGQTYDVDSSTEDNMFKIQTIHSSKGLEYPAVILADMSKGGGGFGSSIYFREPLGLRQAKVYSEDGMPYTYDNWRSYVCGRCLSGDHDEERRLFYVAMTRARNYLFLTAESGKEGNFFKGMDIEPEHVEPVVPERQHKKAVRKELLLPPVSTPSPAKYTPHSFAKGVSSGLGTAYGQELHDYAERYVKDGGPEPENVDQENVKDFIDSSEGELHPEVNFLLPAKKDGRRILFQGVIDLLVVDEQKVKLVDYKTDRSRDLLQEYFKQLSIYYHAVRAVYPDREVEGYVLYTEDGSLVPLEVVPMEDLLDGV